jgi:integrase
MVDDPDMVVSAVVVSPGRPVGLLEKLVAVVRPQFRAGLLVFDPRDPVFGGPACGVDGCERPRRQKGLCTGHVARWREHGRPALDAWTAGAEATFGGRRALQGCLVRGCEFGLRASGLCPGHWSRWMRAGYPDVAGWGPAASPVRTGPDAPTLCTIAGCRLWAHPGAPFCFGHRRRWTRAGLPAPEVFAEQVARDQVPKGERIDLTGLPTQLHLEIAYVLQCRRDEAGVQLLPDQVQTIVDLLAATGLTSLLEVTEQEWAGAHGAGLKKRLGAPAFVRDAYQRIEALAFGRGWQVEYPRAVWRMRHLGLSRGLTATLNFTGIEQPWLMDLAKRWAHRQLRTGLSVATAYNSVRAVTRFAGYLARSEVGVRSAADLDRGVLERYLGDLAVEMAGAGRQHLGYVQGLAGFLRAIHQNGWQGDLPASAQVYPDVDYPRRPERLPRGLPAAVMAQVESPANLDRWTDPAHRVITLILIRTGLRISSAVGLPFDCLVTDADGAPYLRYWNTKMKREALVPIDDELHADVLAQQRRVLARFPAGAPVLFPRPRANLHGAIPVMPESYRDALAKWLALCEVRDEHGRAVHLTPHQWRHTLGTTLINNDVPQHVIQKLLDHDSAEMTAHYARLSDDTVRRHWEAARKVNHRGEQVQVDPAGPLADAAWAKHRLGHATQVLPNGYCGLPLVKTCQHANACLTCPLFITTGEFLPQHRTQHGQTLQLVTAAQARGQIRMAEMNQQVADNLQKIITSLEDEAANPPTTGGAGAQGVVGDAC